MSPQVHQQFDRLMRKGAFNPIRRFLTGADADDRLAEGIAMSYEAALRKADQGELVADAIVILAARLRAIEIRRQFVKGGQPRRDALHRANYTDGRTEVFHLDGLMDDAGEWHGEGNVDLQVAWLAATSLDPAEQLAAAVDLDSWLTGLPSADRELLAGRMAGFSLQELASHTDRSITSVFQRLRDLGTDLAHHADIMMVKKTRKPRRKAATATA
jgi:hypothetical protein